MSDPRPTTAADLREQARQIRETAARRVREIEEAAEREALRFEDAAVLVERMDSGLSSYREESTMTGTMMGTEKMTGEERRRLGIAKAKGSKHPFPRAIYKSGSTVTQWAADHGLDRNIVKSWFAKGSACRPIPKKYATEIEKTLGIPATEESWRAGIR